MCSNLDFLVFNVLLSLVLLSILQICEEYWLLFGGRELSWSIFHSMTSFQHNKLELRLSESHALQSSY